MWYAGDAGEVKTNVSHNTDMLLSRSRTHLSERESARTHARERKKERERERERERESLFVTPQLIQIAWSLGVCVCVCVWSLCVCVCVCDPDRMVCVCVYTHISCVRDTDAHIDTDVDPDTVLRKGRESVWRVGA